MVKLRLDSKKEEWIQLPKGSREKGSIYLDGTLYQSFFNAKRVMKKKSIDLVVVCSGYPGSGKSKIVSQIASFCDPTFTEDRMYQKSEDFRKAVEEETEILKSYVLDEAWEGLSSAQVRREVGQLFLNLMNTIRQKRLFIFVVLPDYFDLSKSMAIFRSRWLIHCYGEYFGDIGKFICFDRHAKKQLYLRGKQNEDYSAYRSDFKGKFYEANSPRFNWDRYEKEIKPKAIAQRVEEQSDDKNAVRQRNKLMLILKLKHKYKVIDLSKILDLEYRYTSSLTVKAERKEDPEFIKQLKLGGSQPGGEESVGG